MEKQDLISIINDYYDGLVNQVNTEWENLKFDTQEKSQEYIDEMKKRNAKDKSDFIDEITKTREFNLKQLEIEEKEIDSILTDLSIEQDDKLKKLKKKIFNNKFCVYFPRRLISDNFLAHFGALFSFPIYLDENEISSIK